MLRGQLGRAERDKVLFVFEGLVGTLPERSRQEARCIRRKRWEWALDYWSFDYQVLDYINRTMQYHDVEVVTWKPAGFAAVLHDRLWAAEVFVDATKSASYRSLSQRTATDTRVSLVYDPDPTHRWGYGFKAREFSIGDIR